jgi:hypothetical protein
MTVWKFPFALGGRVALYMPTGAKVLHVEAQGGMPCVWALVDEKAPVQRRDFVMVGTGHDLPPIALRHVGSFQVDANGSWSTPTFVWHLFEVEP